MSDDWSSGDPFADPNDPEARERAERRREREEKRAQRDAKRKGKQEAKAPAPPPAVEVPKAPRTPEQEFWNEDPEPAASESAESAATQPAAPEPVPAERAGRRWGMKKRKGKDEIAEKSRAEESSAAAAAAAGVTPREGATPPSEPAPSEGATPPSETAAAGEAPPSETKRGQAAAAPSEVAPSGSAPREPAPSAKAPIDPVPSESAPEPVAGAPRTGEGKLPPPLPVEPLPTAEQSLPAPATGPATGEQPLTGVHQAAGEPPTTDEPEPPHTGEPPQTGEHPLPGEHNEPRTGEYAPLTDQHELPSDEWDAPPAREAIWDDEGDPELTGAAAARRGRSGRGGERKGGGGVFGALRRHPFLIAAVIVLIILLWFLNALFQPFHGDGEGKLTVKVPKGASVSEVGDLLDKRGVIDSSTMFQIRVTLDGKRSSLYAGNFTLQKGMSYGSAIDALSTPPVKRVTAVTVPEGYTRSQAGQIIKEDGVPGNYEKATVKSKFLKPAEYGGKGAKDLEGFLFPNTFELRPKAPVSDLVELQLKDFKKQIKKVDMKYAKSKNLTVYDVLIIASMIEREAGVAKQRKLVASVIYNRLKEGMPLGIDATIRFAVDNYEKPLTESELAVDSPYNTRTNVGLPPGPINSPGLDAINAAAHPAKTDFVFYVNKPNTCGELAFAKTEAEFEDNVAAYEKAREENGGNEPSSC